MVPARRNHPRHTGAGDRLVPHDAKGQPQKDTVIGEDELHVTPGGDLVLAYGQSPYRQPHWIEFPFEDRPHSLTFRHSTLADPDALVQISVHLSGQPKSWAITPDGKTLAVAVEGRLIRFFDIQPKKPVPLPKPKIGPDGKPVKDVFVRDMPN